MTGGRYRRVWTPLDEKVLRVDDAEGHALPIEVLSRGTREQLFLSLRLALANSYARRGAQLPLVLDDVLVNFDLARAKAAAGVLRDFARSGHQLLVFTCHEHIMKLFKSLKVPVSLLPENTSSASAFTLEAKTPKPVLRPAPQKLVAEEEEPIIEQMTPEEEHLEEDAELDEAYTEDDPESYEEEEDYEEIDDTLDESLFEEDDGDADEVEDCDDYAGEDEEYEWEEEDEKELDDEEGEEDTSEAA